MDVAAAIKFGLPSKKAEKRHRKKAKSEFRKRMEEAQVITPDPNLLQWSHQEGGAGRSPNDPTHERSKAASEYSPGDTSKDGARRGRLYGFRQTRDQDLITPKNHRGCHLLEKRKH